MTARRRDEAGFTLIELMVVVVILGVVAALAIVALVGALDRAKQRATMADMRSVSKAIEAYSVDNGFVPSDAGGLEGAADDLVPYAITVLPVNDHWGHPYVYSAPTPNDYTILSYGKDGIDGEDITISTRFDYNRDLMIVNGLFVAAPE